MCAPLALCVLRDVPIASPSCFGAIDRRSKHEATLPVEEENGPNLEEVTETHAGKENEPIKKSPTIPVNQTLASPPLNKKAKDAQVRVLVASTRPRKSSDEMLAVYAGREDELIKNLEKMQAEQSRIEMSQLELADDKKAAVIALVKSVQPGRSASELLVASKGREADLIKNLKKMQIRQRKDAQRAKSAPLDVTMDAKKGKDAEVCVLVARTRPRKSSDELLAAYLGRKDELIKNLKKMQAEQTRIEMLRLESAKDKKAEVIVLADTIQPGRSASELLAAFEGKEDKLIKNLKKMQIRQRKDEQ